jgi:hypothetical protein
MAHDMGWRQAQVTQNPTSKDTSKTSFKTWNNHI